MLSIADIIRMNDERREGFNVTLTCFVTCQSAWKSTAKESK